MRKKQMVFRPTGEVRLVKTDEYYLQDNILFRCHTYTTAKYPIYKAVEEIVDVPLWRAEQDEKYSYLDEWGRVQTHSEGCHKIDDARHNVGNYFNGQQEAEKYRDALKFILNERLLNNPKFTEVIESIRKEKSE